MTKQLPDYFIKLHDVIRKDTHCGWSDTEKESLVKQLTPNDEGFPLFECNVLPVQGGAPKGLDFALAYLYNGDKDRRVTSV